MSAYGNSASREAAALRQKARGGPVRRLLARVGVDTVDHQMMAQATRFERGGEAEEATLAMLQPLRRYGWQILPDRLLPDGRAQANLDDVLVTDDGIVVLDVKAWDRHRITTLVQGRVCCGMEDRHEQVEKVAGYASRVARLVGMPADRVWPLLVVHGSRVAAPGFEAGRLEVRAPKWAGPVHVLGPEWLVPTLARAGSGRDAGRAEELARRVAGVLPPYPR
ncbi:nuclease-related domain-containing protein [Streptomyces sp. NBC_00847]|uniref:nuclease-related domain-containing protein n=1 Tax=Streptomyces sp. NBC_00847 TaxID=2975850 RepID=UPI00225E4BEE|nr:nuclease-related domain-containing protein [Streptomyces sp. NBC_00847]MCX4885922.1 NERD domain-containing protein [Streptomyces sp. NBC_00847]